MSVSAVSARPDFAVQMPTVMRRAPKAKPNPQQTVTAAPFTRHAEAQRAAIRTGRIPRRGMIVDMMA